MTTANTTGSPPMFERIRAAIDALLASPKGLPATNNGFNSVQYAIDNEFALARARGEEFPLADGARFIGANVGPGERPGSLQIYWLSGYTRHPLHRNVHVPPSAQPLGHYRGADLHGEIGHHGAYFAAYAAIGPAITQLFRSDDKTMLEGDPMIVSVLMEAWRRLDLLAQGPPA